MKTQREGLSKGSCLEEKAARAQVRNSSLPILSTLLSCQASHWPKLHKTGGQGNLGIAGSVINSRATEWGTDVRANKLFLGTVRFAWHIFFCPFIFLCLLIKMLTFFFSISCIAYNFVSVVGLIIPEWMLVSFNFFSCGYFGFIEFFCTICPHSMFSFC